MAVREDLVAGRSARALSAPADVRLETVTKRFDDVVAVDGISLEVPRGSFFALLGPSGCGKTTTLRIIGGFEEPNEGTIFLGDRDITGLPPYKRDVNTVFQSYALFPHLSIFDNVAFGLRRRGVRGGDLRGRVHRILELVQLAGFERRKPRQLSGGQQQRVALARALVNSPRVLLLDEPLGALDLKLRKEMQLFIKGLQHDIGTTFVHVTHDQEEAMTMADTIAVMKDGRIEQLDSPSELYEHPRTAFVAGFLGVSNLLRGTAEGDGTVRLADGTALRVPAVGGRGGAVAVGVRPEKIRIGGLVPRQPPPNGVTDENTLSGEIVERSYIGVSTQYIVETPSGAITIYAQNTEPGAGATQPGDQVTISWSPESTFVVETEKESSE
jgi:spermidine/putrescine transport system ATP-binding protein